MSIVGGKTQRKEEGRFNEERKREPRGERK